MLRRWPQQQNGNVTNINVTRIGECSLERPGLEPSVASEYLVVRTALLDHDTDVHKVPRRASSFVVMLHADILYASQALALDREVVDSV